MTSTEFKEKLSEAFKTSLVMKDRDYHTVNELLYVLEHNERFHGEDFNISVKTLDGHFWCICSLDTFVHLKLRGIWFNDADVEFEVDEFEYDDETHITNCVTIYECEREEE